jgi:hypothetical protein
MTLARSKATREVEKDLDGCQLVLRAVRRDWGLADPDEWLGTGADDGASGREHDGYD